MRYDDRYEMKLLKISAAFYIHILVIKHSINKILVSSVVEQLQYITRTKISRTSNNASQQKKGLPAEINPLAMACAIFPPPRKPILFNV